MLKGTLFSKTEMSIPKNNYLHVFMCNVNDMSIEITLKSRTSQTLYSDEK